MSRRKPWGLLHQTAFDANQAQDVEHALKGCLDSICAYQAVLRPLENAVKTHDLD